MSNCCTPNCYQEENDVGQFFLSLEKDPQQEEFLQGRMQGNPYLSTTAGLGPLMRDVKNKICTGRSECGIFHTRQIFHALISDEKQTFEVCCNF